MVVEEEEMTIGEGRGSVDSAADGMGSVGGGGTTMAALGTVAVVTPFSEFGVEPRLLRPAGEARGIAADVSVCC